MASPSGQQIQPLSAGVGEGQPNLKRDGALVQAALKLIKNSKGAPFLTGTIDGVVGVGTVDAIRRFQTERLKQGAAPGQLGRVLPGSPTVAALEAALPPATRLGAIPDSKVVYRAASAAQLIEANNKLAAETKFTAAFRDALKSLNQALFAADALVLTIAPKGGYRSFQQQYDLPGGVTGAGPGESNHNFGNGCDFGFYKFSHLSAHGIWQDESEWLSVALEKAGLHLAFWERRNSYFSGRGLYPSKRANDHVHVQSFDDNAVSMQKSLADLMSRKAPNCYWSVKSGSYACSLIFGDTDKQWPVGGAKAIWHGEAAVSTAALAEALEMARTLRNRQPTGRFEPVLETAYGAFAGASRSPTKPWTAAEITSAQIATMRRHLREDFVAAEAAYGEWQPRR